MTDLLKLILGVLASLFKSRAELEAEVLVLRGAAVGSVRNWITAQMMDVYGAVRQEDTKRDRTGRKETGTTDHFLVARLLANSARNLTRTT